MTNNMEELSASEKWHVLVDAAKQALHSQGYTIKRVPGRGLSNIWNITKNGKTQIASIRTTRDRWFAFPPLKGGQSWKTLDDADIVIVAAVDNRKHPENVEVYLFPANEVRKCFDAAYAARIAAEHVIKDNFGMWVGLDTDRREVPRSVGSGIIEHYPKIFTRKIKDLVAERRGIEGGETKGDEKSVTVETFTTIADVMAWTRERVAHIAGVNVEAVKLDLKVEY